MATRSTTAITDDIDRILIPKEKIDERVRAMASEIAESYGELQDGLTLVTILSGSIIFLADLIRQLPIRMRLGLVTVTSYRGATTEGEEPEMKMVRFRTLGCYPLTGAVESEATTLPEIIQEMLLTTTSERKDRVIDFDQAGSMEEKKKQGYF